MSATSEERVHSLRMTDRVSLLRSLTPILLPDQRDPKQLVELILETSEDETARQIEEQRDFSQLSEDELGWLMVCAVYKGSRGLRRGRYGR